ncbi:MAG: phenylalanine--tRNA ligase subunit alpha [Phenylobacterium sp.]|uniref:phenylalanine--tRNA ligase subunit alpha n=1 Tax=Phenylobacterium sp. TaxID=1871053 RepID=UPI001B493E71|nr:phenylalanine--tRNA ligase subunit alpha [Phenylobacterium sp.]MBP7817153.1 phenylalanine--tRNA ligase subunit alpha [Phenylobacterium sp.]MBP9230573.1 phenylalanine--tRNA ligase subunit alpha [Phenylobacterium sp.]
MTAKLEADLTAAIAAATDLSALEAVRVSALGKSGAISDLLKSLGGMSPDERREQGPLINGLRDRVAAAIAERKAGLEAAELDARLAGERVDLSLPPPPRRRGGVHPTMQVMDEMIAIFADMGFSLAEGPDIETDFNNFTALNFPPKHPAREMHDTFFLPENEQGERKVLRTHTSPVQVRVMNRTNQKPAAPWIAAGQEPPIRVIVPGRTFRKDSDQTHTPMFHQIEGLVIDKAIHMGHLKWTLETFLGRFFETPDVVTRFRPHHFPFTEPSAEMDVQCDRSGGEVKIGQGTDWLEILGCGMVHPNVLRNCGLDPDVWQGFAFGCGVDRLGVLKYGMPDLRDMFATDARWLAHYGFSAFAAPNPASGLS